METSDKCITETLEEILSLEEERAGIKHLQGYGWLHHGGFRDPAIHPSMIKTLFYCKANKQASKHGNILNSQVTGSNPRHFDQIESTRSRLLLDMLFTCWTVGSLRL